VTVRLTLHGYQEKAVSHLHSTGERGAGLFLDMGLGKTATVLSALTPEHLPALVLAPKRVARHVWPAEGRLWRPDLQVVPALGTPQQRATALRFLGDVTVMTHDTVGDVPKNHRFKTVVLDELSAYKTKTTERWKKTKPIARGADHVWGLTGTPTPNGYLDLWAQVFLLDNGKRLGTTLTAYRERYFYVTKRLPVTNIAIEWTPKPGAIDAINALLADLCISMRAEDFLETQTAPTFIDVQVDLPRHAKTAYDDLKANLVTTLGDGTVLTAANSAVLGNKLLQVSAGFLYDDLRVSHWLHDEKIMAAKDIVEQAHRGTLIFYNFIPERDRLLAEIPGARAIDEPGVIEAWNAGKVKALIAHPKSAGHGLNLQHGGHTLVYTSLPWSLELYGQSLGRLARQGQTNAVLVYTLSAVKEDRVVWKALQDKEDVQTALMRYLQPDVEASKYHDFL
jgi:hypothetical protein